MGAGAVAAGRMKFEVSHRTSYVYRYPVTRSHHLLHLAPRQLERQSIIRYSLLVDPAPTSRTEIVDYFGNAATILTINGQHSELAIHTRSAVEVTETAPPRVEQSAPWEEVRGYLAQTERPSNVGVAQFTCESRHGRKLPSMMEYARVSFPEGRPTLEGAFDLTRRIYKEFKFDPAATDISTPVEDVLRDRRGVCQDFAHLAISGLRSLGLPARYVSGYILTLPPPGQAKLQGADASHAWISVWAPESGWVDFDPTNGLIPNGKHITVAYGRDYEDVSPISGVLLGGGEQGLSVAVDVNAI